MAVTTLLAALAIGAPVGDRLLMMPYLGAQDWAELANYYMMLGEEKAVAGLVERSRRPMGGEPRIDYNTRTCLMARLIFDPKKVGEPLRHPKIGSLALPYRSMPLKDWPLYPFVKQGEAVFLMSEGLGGGNSETCEAYIAYLRKNGIFRRRLYKVPSEEEARKALNVLYASPRWKAIEWSFVSRNEGYRINPSMVTEYLAKQTKPADFD